MPVEGALGPHLAGEKITVNSRTVQVIKQLGEGGFSFVYLVKDESGGGASQHSQGSASAQSSATGGRSSTDSSQHHPNHLVLKITSIHSRNQRDIAEKEAKLLSRLSHPSIVRMIDTCYRSTPSSGRGDRGGDGQNPQPRPQHLILMEYCEGGTALSVCTALQQAGQRFDLPSLIIAFGQICNAVSYLHAQRPPIVHRDLKPVNFLVKNGAYKLCDFGSAVFGHVDLKTQAARVEAEEVVQKTTTQMFRAPEMVDLYMTKKLTQATDVWALGCCLYSLAFFQNCFEEGSNLAILSRNYKIPEDNPYGDGLVELIDRMLTVDVKARADMTEVILCLSAIYSGRPLPPRKQPAKKKDKDKEGEGASAKVGAYRTDGQGIRQAVVEQKKAPEARKLDPNSAAARRKRAVKTEAAPIGGDKAFETSFGGAFNTKQAEGAGDPFGQTTTDGKEYDPLSFSNLGGDDDQQAAAFPAFGETSMPSSEGAAAAFPLDDSFDANKVSFSSFDASNREESGSSDIFNDPGNLSDSLKKQANITNAKDRPEKGKKNGGVKGLFKMGGK